MRSLTALLFSVAMLSTAISCNGPAFPDRDARAYLEKNRYSQAIVDAVMGGGPLQHEQIVELSKCKSADVRFLVGRNPTLSVSEIDIFIRDRDDYARSGTARNPNLNSAQIELLFNDPSYTVYSNLASNPQVPKHILMKLHRERQLGLVNFAMNPKCPPELIEQIKQSGDSLAIEWLGIMEQKRNKP